MASASSTGLSATRWRSTQPLRPDGLRAVVAKVACEPGLAHHEGLRRVRELLELLAVGGVDGRLGPAFERDPFRGLARDLPVDGSGRLQHPHHLAEVDLREVERRRVEFARGHRCRRPPNRKGGKTRQASRAVVGLVGVSGLRRSATRSVYGGAFRRGHRRVAGSWGSHLLPVLAAHPDVERVLGARRARARAAQPRRSNSPGSTSPAPSSSRCSRASTWSCTSPAWSTRSPTSR